MKYTNYFLNKNEYNELICNQIQNSLNYYKETKEFNFFDEDEKESYIIATYDVISTTSNTRLLGSAFTLSQITEMYIDDVKLDNVVNAYMFETEGEHTVKFVYNNCIQQITSFYSMFYNCQYLTSIEFSDNFYTSNVTNMNSMFYNCNNLTSITFGDKADVSNVTSYSYMFSSVPTSCTLTLCEKTRDGWDKLISSYTLNVVYVDCKDAYWIPLSRRYESVVYDKYKKLYTTVSPQNKIFGVFMKNTNKAYDYCTNLDFSTVPYELNDYTSQTTCNSAFQVKHFPINHLLLRIRNNFQPKKYMLFSTENIPTDKYTGPEKIIDDESILTYSGLTNATIECEGNTMNGYVILFDKPVYLSYCQPAVDTENFYLLVKNETEFAAFI